MGGTVYDPIHDVFQETSTSVLLSKSEHEHDHEHEHEESSDKNSDGPARIPMSVPVPVPVRAATVLRRKMPVLSRGSGSSVNSIRGITVSQQDKDGKSGDKEKEAVDRSNFSDDDTTQSEDNTRLSVELPLNSTVKGGNTGSDTNSDTDTESNVKVGQPEQEQEQKQKRKRKRRTHVQEHAQSPASKRVRKTNDEGSSSSVATTRGPSTITVRHGRHLKKPDGDYFTRKDIQYSFIDALLNDKREVFTNIFKDFYLNSLSTSSTEKKTTGTQTQSHKPKSENSDTNKNLLNPTQFPDSTTTTKVLNVGDPEFNARRFIHHERVTFSQLYLLNVATSTKCSKILRDKLLSDHNVAHSTCLLGILVNIKRLNTTINFYLEMTSQLRTFHCVPSLQYSSGGMGAPKSLQDTPRLKSILKNLPIGNEPIDLVALYRGKNGNSDKEGGEEEKEKERTRVSYNVANMIFVMLDNLSLINSKFLNNEKYVRVVGDKDGGSGDGVSLFQILDTYYFDIESRVNVFLWLVYIHLETDLSESAIEDSMKLFGKELEPACWRILLRRNTLSEDAIDVDLDYEVEFGLDQKRKRREFLEKIQKSKEIEGVGGSEEGRGKEPNNNNNNNNNTGNNDSKDQNTPIANNDDDNGTLIPPKKRRRRRKRKADTDLEAEIAAELASQSLDGDSILGAIENKVKRRRRGRKRKSLIKEEELDDEGDLILNGKSDDTLLFELDMDEYVRDFSAESLLAASAADGSLTGSSRAEQIERLVEVDLNKKVYVSGTVVKSQQEFLDDLLSAHEWVRLKRQEVGLLKIFNEFEDITMASVIGIRGKKRKKFKDELLGFETDYLRNFIAAKKIMMDSVGDEEEEVDHNLFSL